MATDTLTRKNLEALADSRQGPCVSIFLPTHRVTLETQEDRVRLDNLLREAGRELKKKGRRDVKEFLAPATDLLEDLEFWRHQDHGLAIFLADGFSARYRVPIELDEWLHIGESFQIRPLLPLPGDNGIFYLLALSQNEVSLYRGSRDRFEPVDSAGLPESLEWALRFDERESQLQWHTETGGGRNGRPAMFHGHGVGKDDEKDRVERFTRKVDKAIREYLSARSSPLVLAAVEYVASIYKSVSAYPELVDSIVEGNPEQMKREDLHAKAWEIVQPVFEKSKEEALEDYDRNRGAGKSGTDLAKTLKAAFQGGVDTLFLAEGVSAYGRFEPESLEVELHDGKEERDQELLNEASRWTLLKGGEIHVLPRDEMPESAAVAAVYRF